MKDAKPDSLRMIAFTLRGYKGTSDFDRINQPINHEIGPIIGEDFIAIVNYVVDTIKVPHNNGSSLNIVAWSLAAASLIAGYGSLIPAGRGPYPKWTTYISRIVFYEPAGGRGFFIEAWKPNQPQPASKKHKTEHGTPAPQIDVIAIFKRLASLYYRFSDGFFSKPHLYGIPRENESFKETTCLVEDYKDAWRECTEGIFEQLPNDFYSRLLYRPAKAVPSGRLRSKEEQKEADRIVNNKFAHDALVVMARTDVKRIQGVSTKWTLPACVLATEWLRDVVKEVNPNKSLLTWIEGRNNHYVHSLNPKKLWDALKAGEV